MLLKTILILFIISKEQIMWTIKNFSYYHFTCVKKQNLEIKRRFCEKT